jgi:hypothetical protein
MVRLLKLFVSYILNHSPISDKTLYFPGPGAGKG